MTELMIKMTSWLVAAMALGFIVAWLLSRTLYKRKESYVEDTFSAVMLERNNMVEKLEKSFRNKQVMFEKISRNLKYSEKALAEKTSRLTTLQHSLNTSRSNEDSILDLKEKNSLLLKKNQQLEQADRQRISELEGFEEIVLLAEKKVEESEQSHRQIVRKLDDEIEDLILENQNNKKNIKRYSDNIDDLKEELKLYKADSSEVEFIISKDQFVKIEEQLISYKNELELLKNENNKLQLKSKESFNSFSLMERRVEEKILHDLENKEDDGSMVKVFKETYKKITNS